MWKYKLINSRKKRKLTTPLIWLANETLSCRKHRGHSLVISVFSIKFLIQKLLWLHMEQRPNLMKEIWHCQKSWTKATKCNVRFYFFWSLHSGNASYKNLNVISTSPTFENKFRLYYCINNISNGQQNLFQCLW